MLRTASKRTGCVITPKPHFSSCEGINSHCRRLDVLPFAVLAQSVAAKYYRSCAAPSSRGDSTVTALLLVSLVHSPDTCAMVGLRDSFWVLFAYKKMLGRTETRTRDRMYCQSIRTV